MPLTWRDPEMDAKLLAFALPNIAVAGASRLSITPIGD
jgi:hypothetical protein